MYGCAKPVECATVTCVTPASAIALATRLTPRSDLSVVNCCWLSILEGEGATTERQAGETLPRQGKWLLRLDSNQQPSG